MGSCAQIDEKVHLSGGVRIGSVSEPVQAALVIVEKNDSAGGRSSVVDDISTGKAVLRAILVLAASTQITNISRDKSGKV